MKQGQAPKSGFRHRRRLAVPFPLAATWRRSCGGRDGAGGGREKGGAARSLLESRGRLVVGVSWKEALV